MRTYKTERKTLRKLRKGKDSSGQRNENNQDETSVVHDDERSLYSTKSRATRSSKRSHFADEYKPKDPLYSRASGMEEGFPLEKLPMEQGSQKYSSYRQKRMILFFILTGIVFIFCRYNLTEQADSDVILPPVDPEVTIFNKTDNRSVDPYLDRQTAPDVALLQQQKAPQTLDSQTAPDDASIQKEEPLAIISSKFSNLADLTVADPNRVDTPFLWQIPMSGANTIRAILNECLGFTFACEKGGQTPLAGEKLQVFTVANENVVNVDTTNVGGIERAKSLNITSSNLVDVIISPYVHEITALFTPEHKGRMFAMIRNPVERAASTYAYLKAIDPVVANMTLKEYASSGRFQNNWMTRFLSNTYSGDIGVDHLFIAKEVLKTKCLVGMEWDYFKSMTRFELYFGWNLTTNEQWQCRKKHLWDKVDANKYPAPEVETGGSLWGAIMWQNRLDMKLFEYAELLFEEQASLFPDGPGR